VTALWQRLSSLWRNRKPIQVPIPPSLRRTPQLAGGPGPLTAGNDRSAVEVDLELDRIQVAAETGTAVLADNDRLADVEEAPSDEARRLDPPDSLEAQMRALREEVASLTATLSSEQQDRHEVLDSALKDLAGHAGAHNQSLVQMHEDLQLMTQTEREAVSRISELSHAAAGQTTAQQELVESVRKLEAKTAADMEAITIALTRTRQTILAVTLIAAGGAIVLIPMIVALFT
jgi:chromosome segregation ATPase